MSSEKIKANLVQKRFLNDKVGRTKPGFDASLALARTLRQKRRQPATPTIPERPNSLPLPPVRPNRTMLIEPYGPLDLSEPPGETTRLSLRSDGRQFRCSSGSGTPKSI